jgi:hypothetical protein
MVSSSPIHLVNIYVNLFAASGSLNIFRTKVRSYLLDPLLSPHATMLYCISSHVMCIVLFMHMLLYCLLLILFTSLCLWASSNDLYVTCCISSCTRASSNDLCVAWCNSSQMWASSNDLCVAQCCTSSYTLNSSSDLCIVHCNSLRMLCPPLGPSMRRARIAFVVQCQTWEGPTSLF